MITQHEANSSPVAATARVRRRPRTSASTGSCATAIVQVLAAKAKPTRLRGASATPVAHAGNAEVECVEPRRHEQQVETSRDEQRVVTNDRPIAAGGGLAADGDAAVDLAHPQQQREHSVCGGVRHE